jgi:hypothetical protein
MNDVSLYLRINRSPSWPAENPVCGVSPSGFGKILLADPYPVLFQAAFGIEPLPLLGGFTLLALSLLTLHQLVAIYAGEVGKLQVDISTLVPCVPQSPQHFCDCGQEFHCLTKSAAGGLDLIARWPGGNHIKQKDAAIDFPVSGPCIGKDVHQDAKMFADSRSDAGL